MAVHKSRRRKQQRQGTLSAAAARKRKRNESDRGKAVAMLVLSLIVVVTVLLATTTQHTQLQVMEWSTLTSLSINGTTAAAASTSAFSNDVVASTPASQQGTAGSVVVNPNHLETVLKQADIAHNFTKAELQRLWQDISQLYYSKRQGPIVWGTERCEEFRKLAGPNATIAIAGMYNMGTNALLQNLQANLYFPHNGEEEWDKHAGVWSRLHGIHAEVPWWKHNPRFINDESLYKEYWKCCTRDPVRDAHILPIVVVRDPLTWRRSMCDHTYKMSWKNSSRPENHGHCPRLQDKITFGAPVKLQRRVPTPQDFVIGESLMDVWNQFYQIYMNKADFPFLVVRMEDALFHLPEIMESIRACAGASHRPVISGDGNNVMVLKGSSKWYRPGNGLLATITKTADRASRTAGMKPPELEYTQKTLDSELLQAFGYVV